MTGGGSAELRDLRARVVGLIERVKDHGHRLSELERELAAARREMAALVGRDADVGGADTRRVAAGKKAPVRKKAG